MFADDDFTITLPSNVAEPQHPQNKPAHYTTTLPSPIMLEGEWECALMNISYPYHWDNISKTGYLIVGCRHKDPIPTILLNAFFNWNHRILHSTLYPHIRPARYLTDAPVKRTRREDTESAQPEQSEKETVAETGQEQADAPAAPLTKPLVDEKDNDFEKFLRLMADGKTKFHIAEEVYLPSNPELVALTKYVAIYNQLFSGDDDTILVIPIPPSRYEQPGDLAEEVVRIFNSVVPDSLKEKYKLQSNYNSNTKKLNFTISEKVKVDAIVCNDPEICEHLGIVYDPDQKGGHCLLKEGYTEKTPVIRDLSNLFIYLDCIKLQNVGNTLAPLLSVIPVEVKNNRQLTYVCNPSYYVALNRGVLDKIEVKLCDPFGNVIGFRKNYYDAHVCVQINIRRKRGIF